MALIIKNIGLLMSSKDDIEIPNFMNAVELFAKENVVNI